MRDRHRRARFGALASNELGAAGTAPGESLAVAARPAQASAASRASGYAGRQGCGLPPAAPVESPPPAAVASPPPVRKGFRWQSPVIRRNALCDQVRIDRVRAEGVLPHGQRLIGLVAVALLRPSGRACRAHPCRDSCALRARRSANPAGACSTARPACRSWSGRPGTATGTAAGSPTVQAVRIIDRDAEVAQRHSGRVVLGSRGQDVGHERRQQHQYLFE